MSVLSALSTLLSTTLLYIHAFFSRLFRRRTKIHTSPITPYPLAPQLENSIIELRRDGTHAINGGVDVEKGVFSVASPFAGHAGFYPRTASGTNIPRPQPKFGRERNPGPPPLSVVTNLARRNSDPPRHVPHRSYGEKFRPGHSQEPRRTPSTRRTSRSFNLTGSSLATSETSAERKPRRRSLVCFNPAPSRRSLSISTAGSSPFISPKKLESGLPEEAVDLAARIKSVFYKPGVHDDEHESVRDVFNRDSVFAIRSEESFIRRLDGTQDFDEEDDNGKPVSGRSTYYSCSTVYSCDTSFDAPTPAALRFQIRTSDSSELPYLRNGSSGSLSGLSETSSTSSAAFSDLLASVERTYPGNEWRDIVTLPAAAGGKNREDRERRKNDLGTTWFALRE
ncbi:hypothetical protein B0H11DRAFT_2294064 [Mycena galericulata]|nr:hypothetical protein B0H11DRAFT_2294064 [Mycena galericulata]